MESKRINNALTRYRTLLLGATLTIILGVMVAISTPWPSAASRAPRIVPVQLPTFRTVNGPIKHIVFLIKENRTFDNYFGAYPGADGATTARTITGKIVPLAHQPDVIGDPYHHHADSVKAFDNGKMDGFQLIGVPGVDKLNTNDPYANSSLSQFLQSDIPNYWQYAQDFVLGDRMFSSVAGPSFPNHLFTVAAQSGGTIDQPLSPHGPDWGCESNTNTVDVWNDASQTFESQPVCFDFATLADQLSGANYSWRYYAPGKVSGGKDFKGNRWSIMTVIRHIRYSGMWQNVVPIEQFKIDAMNGDLPTVSWVIPYARFSEHPNFSVCLGQSWTVDLLNSIMEGPDWNSTAVFIVWDDFGGLYDHVPPPQVDRFGWGFRAPLLVISPFAKKGYVDHTQYEFSSVLRFTQDSLGLEATLSDRDANANNMMNAFDFSQTPRAPLIQEPKVCPNAPELLPAGWDYQD
jgi:phospholipase C